MPASSSSAKKLKAKKKPVKGRKIIVPAADSYKPRRLHLPAYQPFRFKRIKRPNRLPTVWQLSKTNCIIAMEPPLVISGISCHLRSIGYSAGARL